MNALRRALALLFLSIAALLALASTAVAAPGWLDSEARSTAGDQYLQSGGWASTGYSVAMNGRGDAVMVWHRVAGLESGTVQTAIHRAGSPPATSGVLDVSPNDFDPSTGTGTRTGGQEAVTIDDAGNAYVFYSVQGAGGFKDLVYRRSTPGSLTWGPQTILSDATNAGNEAGGLVAATNHGGQTIVYALIGGATTSFLGAPNGTFTNGGPVGNTAGGERIVINSVGDVGLVRFNFGGNYQRVVNTIFRPHGQGWQTGTSRDVTPNVDAESPDIGIATNGTLVVVWSEQYTGPGGSPYKRIWYVVRPPGGPVSTPPQSLSIDGIDSTSPSIGMGGGGEAIIAYQEGAGNILIDRRAPDGTIGYLGYLPDAQASNFTSPKVAVDDRGDAFIAYNAVVGGQQVVRVVRRPVGQAAFGDATTISPANSSGGNIAVGKFGDAIAGFATTPTPGQSQIVVRSAGFDNSGPQLENLNFPSTAYHGVGFGYSVNAVDAWSPVSSVQWAFGDGTTGSGPSGTKTYAANGSYTATVNAFDTRGNWLATGSRDVSVTDQPPSPPGGGPGGGGGGATAVGAISKLATSPKSFFAATAGGSIAKITTGTVITYADTQPGVSKFTVQRPSRGYKKGKRCVRKKPAGVRHPKRCTLYKPLKGSFSHVDTAGTNSFRFTGRLGGKTLRPGSYRLTAVARNAFGKSRAAHTGFTVKRRPKH